MASSFPATFSTSTTSSLESLFPSQHRGTAVSLPALLQPLPEMEEELGRARPRRDHRSLTPTRPTRPPSTRTSSGDDESCTFRSESGLANPAAARKPNELAVVEAELKEEEEGEGEEIEDEEQFRRHSKDDEQLFRSGRRRSI
uniref:(northern house mosquito) hypothetical protein n=1 Tax=Culex pipiens TaxID=7175 RepID=A0A8D8NGD5_CULPI